MFYKTLDQSPLSESGIQSMEAKLSFYLSFPISRAVVVTIKKIMIIIKFPPVLVAQYQTCFHNSTFIFTGGKSAWLKTKWYSESEDVDGVFFSVHLVFLDRWSYEKKIEDKICLSKKAIYCKFELLLIHIWSTVGKHTFTEKSTIRFTLFCNTGKCVQ